ncbi:histidinol phosphatase [Gramella sp. GC03-9]|uniref:protein-tyrosine-phosphatase n=1 Tax=Christiangramia oceanisediminis TaxID=2920386 RepID=A0A9X2I4W1_9FLAO|nr:CpsB/CapC family capsule biosynthesis tyrosine phosphatase [Gramella oceanisediminis]MCP9199915.1 histidinol phosphatase [Gramella oceanisediminis]
MFSIFSKKNYLADLLGGFIDFHNHILPGIDDGAQNIEDSLQLIEEFKNIGIHTIVASPHVMGDFYPNSKTQIREALNKVKHKIQDNFDISAAAEYMMDQNFLDLLKADEILAVHGEHILVEMSYFQQPINLFEVLFSIQNRAYIPILAHPERYTYLHERNLERYRDLKTRGCKFQINMLSLSGHYGEGVQKTAYKLLENDLIDFICTDAHKVDHVLKIKQIKIGKKHLATIQKVIENNLDLFS